MIIDVFDVRVITWRLIVFELTLIIVVFDVRVIIWRLIVFELLCYYHHHIKFHHTNLMVMKGKNNFYFA